MQATYDPLRLGADDRGEMKRLRRETRCGDVLIVTARYAHDDYEVRVIGDSSLDGWAMEAKTEVEADRLHTGVARLVREAAVCGD